MSEVSDDVQRRLTHLEEQFRLHINSTNNPHQTTAELIRAVPQVTYKDHVHKSLAVEMVVLAWLKHARNFLACVGLWSIASTWYWPERVHVHLIVVTLIVSLMGGFASGSVVLQSRHVRQLRAHLNDISK